LRPAMKDYTIFVDGISKSFAATGVRVGWSLGPADVIAKMRAINSHVGSWAPMAEQKAVAKFLNNDPAVTDYLAFFKTELYTRLSRIYEGFIQLKNDGYNIDAVAPQAAIYLTVQIDLVNKKTNDGNLLENQADVTAYILEEAKLALVPFYAFGAEKNNSWYRLSVGRCKKEEIATMLLKLRNSLERLT
jgi:aspartate aminotransferase